MAKMTKRILSLIITGMMVFSILCAPASAAEVSAKSGVTPGIAVPNYIYNNYFKGGTGTLNSVFGQLSKKDPVSSGGTSDTAEVTSVELTVKVSRGSGDFMLYVQSPEGTIATTLVAGSTSAVSRKITLHDFDGEDPEGTWYIFIGTVSTSTVATATVEMKCNYGYDQYA